MFRKKHSISPSFYLLFRRQKPVWEWSCNIFLRPAWHTTSKICFEFQLWREKYSEIASSPFPAEFNRIFTNPTHSSCRSILSKVNFQAVLHTCLSGEYKWVTYRYISVHSFTHSFIHLFIQQVYWVPTLYRPIFHVVAGSRKIAGDKWCGSAGSFSYYAKKEVFWSILEFLPCFWIFRRFHSCKGIMP